MSGVRAKELRRQRERSRAVAACFKEGGYKSFAPYLAKAKEVHISEGFEWTQLLEMSCRKTSHSVLRGEFYSRFRMHHVKLWVRPARHACPSGEV